MEDPKTMADTDPQTVWELVVAKIPGQDTLERIRVDSGWLYRQTTLAGASMDKSVAGQVAVALAFVPDRQEL